MSRTKPTTMTTHMVETSPILTDSQVDLLTAHNDLGDIFPESWDADDILAESQITQTAAPAPNITITSSQMTQNVRVQRQVQVQPLQRHLQQQPLSFHECTVTINYNFHH